MRAAITTFGGDGGKSGISRYIIQLLREFDANPGEFEFDVFLYRDERSIFLDGTHSLRAIELPENLSPPVRNILWHQFALPKLCRAHAYDVLFLPAGNRRLPWNCTTPTVGTVHDFSAIHMEGKYDRARLFYIKKVLPALARRLDRVITVSQSSANDIIEYAKVPADRVDVIPLAADASLYRPIDREEFLPHLQARYGIQAPYLLYVSRLEHPGKNHVRLIRAFDRLRSRVSQAFQLVLVGGDWLRAESVHEEAALARHTQDILFPGFVDDGDLPALYGCAHAMVFPSLYEGFGLPVLEAMSAGTPVACSNLSSMPEVAGNAALLFDPFDEDAIEHTLEQLVTDSELCLRLRRLGLERAAQFSWDRAARAALESLHKAMGAPAHA